MNTPPTRLMGHGTPLPFLPIDVQEIEICHEFVSGYCSSCKSSIKACGLGFRSVGLAGLLLGLEMRSGV